MSEKLVGIGKYYAVCIPDRQAVDDPAAFARRQPSHLLIMLVANYETFLKVLPPPTILRHPHLDSTADGVEKHLARLRDTNDEYNRHVAALPAAVAAEIDRRFPT